MANIKMDSTAGLMIAEAKEALMIEILHRNLVPGSWDLGRASDCSKFCGQKRKAILRSILRFF